MTTMWEEGIARLDAQLDQLRERVEPLDLATRSEADVVAERHQQFMLRLGEVAAEEQMLKDRTEAT